MAVLAQLVEELNAGRIRVVDLTTTLGPTTPVIDLPPIFAPSPGLTLTEISRYDSRGPAWYWDVLTLGEHTGTHFDAPIHWITGQDGEDVASVAPSRLVAPVAVVDKTAEVAADPGYLLTAADLDAYESEHGKIAPGSWVFFRTGWGARAQDEAAFLNAGPE